MFHVHTFDTIQRLNTVLSSPEAVTHYPLFAYPMNKKRKDGIDLAISNKTKVLKNMTEEVFEATTLELLQRLAKLT